MNKLKAEALNFEKKAIKSYNESIRPKRKLEDVVKDGGFALEYIFKALYIRKIESPIEKLTTFQIINSLHKNGVINDSLKADADFLRKKKNATHGTTKFSTKDSNKIKLTLEDVFRQYNRITKRKLKIIDSQTSKNNETISVETLYEKRLITKKQRESLLKKIKSYQIESKKTARSEPSFACLLIDASLSMSSYTKTVVEGHRLAVQALRKSSKCKRDALFLKQSLFNHEIIELNASLTKVDKNAKDRVIELSEGNYRPHSNTALLDSIYTTLIQLDLEITTYKNEYRRIAKGHLGIITDGMDNSSSEYNIEDVRKLVQHLKNEKKLQKAVLIGFSSPEFPEAHVKYLMEELCFDQYISLEKNNPRQIRDGFDLWSQSVIDF